MAVDCLWGSIPVPLVLGWLPSMINPAASVDIIIGETPKIVPVTSRKYPKQGQGVLVT